MFKMNTFSERIGVVESRASLQVSDLDAPTRNRIANKLTGLVYTRRSDGSAYFDSDVLDWIDRVLKKPQSAYKAYNVTSDVENVVLKCPWHTVLTSIEFFLNSRGSGLAGQPRKDRSKLEVSWNQLFEEEGVGYRFTNGELTRVIEVDQAKAIYAASSNSNVSSGAKHHIREALNLLRPGEGAVVDAARVVREAISGCEAQARHSLGDDKITLGQAAKKLAANKNSHPAFVDGISKLYGWTSDEKGIRHASDGTPVSLSTSDAIFFLTIASAFVTWASQP